MPVTPTDNDDVTTDTEAPATEMVNDFVALRPPASTTLTVNDANASAVDVGVPEISPVDEFSVSPSGRLPSMVDQVKGPAPPETARVWEYATARVAGPSNAVEIATGSTTRIDRARVVLRRLASTICTVNDAVLADVGVPDRTPVDVFSVTPAGRLPDEIDHIYGVRPPETANV